MDPGRRRGAGLRVRCSLIVLDPPRPTATAALTANPYRADRFLARVHGVSVLLVVPQFLVWTYSLTWLVQERHWSAAAAGALVAGDPRARRPRPDRGGAALRRGRLAGPAAALGGGAAGVTMALLGADRAAGRGCRAPGRRLHGHRGRQRARLHERGRARRLLLVGPGARRTEHGAVPHRSGRRARRRPGDHRSGGTPPRSASPHCAPWSRSGWCRATTRRPGVTDPPVRSLDCLSRPERTLPMRATTTRSRAVRRLAVAAAISVGAVVVALGIPSGSLSALERRAGGRLQEGVRRQGEDRSIGSQGVGHDLRGRRQPQAPPGSCRRALAQPQRPAHEERRLPGRADHQPRDRRPHHTGPGPSCGRRRGGAAVRRPSRSSPTSR